jgi:tRNA threonylcarbamoyladenosine biosynthesis protein TsaB
MTALAICASTSHLSCALRTAGGLFATAPRNQRGSDLVAEVSELLGAHGRAPADVSELLLDLGPGSYTGLRVAVTFARFFVRFGRPTLHTTSSFELIAAAVLRARPAAPRAGVLHVALDARRSRTHYARIESGPPIRLSTKPLAIELAEFAPPLGAGDVLVADESLHSQLAERCEAARATLAATPEYGATDLFDPAVVLSNASPDSLEPLYLMGSYAE